MNLKMRLSARCWTFLLLWLSYCLVYFTRKPLGIIKTKLEKLYGYSRLTIGLLDSAFLLPYAIFQILLGNLGDSFNSAKLLATCIVISGCSTLLLGPLEHLYVIFLSLFINGAFQAFCWPLSIKIVSILFEKSRNKNFLLGIFGASTFAGGTLGTFLAVFLKDKLGWRWVYPIPSLLIVCSGLVLFLFYKLRLNRLLKAYQTIDISNGNDENKNEIEEENDLNTKKLSKLGTFFSRTSTADKHKAAFKIETPNGGLHLIGNERLLSPVNKNENINASLSVSKTQKPSSITTTPVDYDMLEKYNAPKCSNHLNNSNSPNQQSLPLSPNLNIATASLFKTSFDGFHEKTTACLSAVKSSLLLFWKVPLIMNMAVSMFSLKMIRYIFYMWLPFVLEYQNDISSTHAGNLSALFEIGGVFGSILLGLILDKLFYRSQFRGILYFLFAHILAITGFLLTTNPNSHWLLNSTFLVLSGLMNGGVDNLLSSSAPLLVSACFQTENPSALIGFVNGFGSLGTFLEGPIVGLVLDYSSTAKSQHQLHSTSTGAVSQHVLNLTTTTLASVTLPHVSNSRHAVDIDFRGLFGIIGAFSVVPFVAMLLGYLMHSRQINAYCLQRYLSNKNLSAQKKLYQPDSSPDPSLPTNTVEDADSSSREELGAESDGSGTKASTKSTHSSPNNLTPDNDNINHYDATNNNNNNDMENNDFKIFNNSLHPNKPNEKFNLITNMSEASPFLLRSNA